MLHSLACTLLGTVEFSSISCYHLKTSSEWAGKHFKIDHWDYSNLMFNIVHLTLKYHKVYSWFTNRVSKSIKQRCHNHGFTPKPLFRRKTRTQQHYKRQHCFTLHISITKHNKKPWQPAKQVPHCSLTVGSDIIQARLYLSIWQGEE